MNNNYKDKYSRYHDAPVTPENPIPSNNGYIYSAYSAKLGLPIDYSKLSPYFKLCTHKHPDGSIYFTRHSLSDKSGGAPFSRDEYLGGVYLGLIPAQDNWNFSPFPLPKFSLVKLIKQLWELRPSYERINTWQDDGEDGYYFERKIVWQHRNYFWKNNLNQLYRFAFSVPIQDRHFILKCWEKFQWYNPVHLLYAAVAKVDSLLPKKSGIKWLKYGGKGNLKAMVKEFPVDHPIRVKVGF